MGFGKCKGCGADVLWVKTPKKKNMPCDPTPVTIEPAPQGELFYREDGTPVRGYAKSLPYYDPLKVGYRPHWSACPAAGNFKGTANAEGMKEATPKEHKQEKQEKYEQTKLF